MSCPVLCTCIWRGQAEAGLLSLPGSELPRHFEVAVSFWSYCPYQCLTTACCLQASPIVMLCRQSVPPSRWRRCSARRSVLHCGRTAVSRGCSMSRLPLKARERTIRVQQAKPVLSFANLQRQQQIPARNLSMLEQHCTSRPCSHALSYICPCSMGNLQHMHMCQSKQPHPPGSSSPFPLLGMSPPLGHKLLKRHKLLIKAHLTNSERMVHEHLTPACSHRKCPEGALQRPGLSKQTGQQDNLSHRGSRRAASRTLASSNLPRTH